METSTIQSTRVLNSKPARYIVTLSATDKDALRHMEGLSSKNLNLLLQDQPVTGEVVRKVKAFFTPPPAALAVAAPAAEPAAPAAEPAVVGDS